MGGSSPPPTVNMTPSVNTSREPMNMSDLIQLDGNDSVSSIESESESETSLISPTISGHDKISTAQYLPVVAAYNMRSLFPKIDNLKTDILERQIDVGFFSEIWQKAENKKHQSEIEIMIEKEGLKHISTARPSG